MYYRLSKAMKMKAQLALIRQRIQKSIRIRKTHKLVLRKQMHGSLCHTIKYKHLATVPNNVPPSRP